MVSRSHGCAMGKTLKQMEIRIGGSGVGGGRGLKHVEIYGDRLNKLSPNPHPPTHCGQLRKKLRSTAVQPPKPTPKPNEQRSTINEQRTTNNDLPPSRWSRSSRVTPVTCHVLRVTRYAFRFHDFTILRFYKGAPPSIFIYPSARFWVGRCPRFRRGLVGHSSRRGCLCRRWGLRPDRRR